MASRQDISHNAGEAIGQAQIKKDESLNQASHAGQDASSQNASDLKGQAANFLQQTGEQVKNMAQGAAEAVKNTLGMNTDSPNSPSNNPSNTSTASTNNPTNTGNTATTNPSNPSNPSTRI